jgi:hypothetical protein
MTEKSHDWVVIENPKTGTIVQVLDQNDSCQPYVGFDYAGHCGGCGKCMTMQAEHAGFVLLPSREENMTDFYLRVFAKDMREAFGDRTTEMSDELLQSLRILWDKGIQFGRNGIPPIPEVNDPKTLREALERLAAQ